jgi:hypothetical protein
MVVRVRDWTLRVSVVCLVLSTSPVLDVLVITFFTLHDAVDGAQRAVLAIVVEVTSKLSLFALAVALVDVTASVTAAPILIKVGT